MSVHICITTFILAANLQSPPSTAPATQPAPPLLSGPSALEANADKPTLVQRAFDGRVESVGPQPDMIAISMLALSPEQQVKFDEINAARLSAFDAIIRSNYALVVELGTLAGENNAARRLDALGRAAIALEPYTDRGTFFQEMWPHLTDAQRKMVEAMTAEYRAARIADVRRESSDKSSPRAIAVRIRLEELGEMVRESIERQVGLARDTFEQYATELMLTPEQRNAAEAIFQPLAIKRFQNLEVTKAEEAEAFAAFNKLLSAGQKQKLFGILVRQYQKPAEPNGDPAGAGATTKPASSN